MSYPSQKRRLRPARAVAATVAALLAAGAGLAAMPAQAAPAVPGDPGIITTMGGRTVNYQQGGVGTDEVAATASQFSNPRGLAIAPNGDVYVTDALNQTVRRISSDGIVHRVAGDGTACAPAVGATASTPGWCGDGGSALTAQLNQPHGVAVDDAGNVFIADSNNCVIRMVSKATGNINTIVGTGVKQGSNCKPTAGDPDGAGLSVALDQPKSIFLGKDPATNKEVLYVADKGNNEIRMITNLDSAPQSIRVVGNNQSIRFGGDGGDAKAAQLRHAQGVWVATDGTMYITDSGNNLVRKVAMPTSPGGFRVITTIAGDTANATLHKSEGDTAVGGDQLPGDSDGDGGPAISAHFDGPRGITGDNQGNLFVAEEHGSRIRRINLASGKIDTIAGDGTVVEQRANGGNAFIKGDPTGNALEAQFAYLHDIAINPADGSLWVADSRNNRVRAIANAASAPGAVVKTGGNVTQDTTPSTQPPVQTGGKSGYWMLSEDGRVFGFGDAKNAVYGDVVGRMAPGAKAVHIEPTPSYGGYWINDDKGGVYAFNAPNLGGPDALQAGEKLTSLSSTPTGNGYWLFTSKGRVFAKGDAAKFGDLANVPLQGAIQSSVPTTTGKGYYMVGSDGGVFAFGDAKFFGSMGGKPLNKPVMALVPTRSSQGYWLVASDGGIFAFGDAKFNGSMGGKPLNKPVVGMVRYGNGYLMTGADGGIFDFSGGNGFKGSLADTQLARPITFSATLDS